MSKGYPIIQRIPEQTSQERTAYSSDFLCPADFIFSPGPVEVCRLLGFRMATYAAVSRATCVGTRVLKPKPQTAVSDVGVYCDFNIGPGWRRCKKHFTVAVAGMHCFLLVTCWPLSFGLSSAQVHAYHRSSSDGCFPAGGCPL